MPATVSTTANPEWATLIAQAMLDVAQNHGVWVSVFAFIGVATVFHAALRQGMPLFQVLGVVFIITPIILIRARTAKDPKNNTLSEVQDIKKYLKENPKAKWRVIKDICVLTALIIAVCIVTYMRMP